MCINPQQNDDGSFRSCRDCWQCHEYVRNDWAGRIIAESKTTPYTYFVRLSYGADETGDMYHLRTAILTYSDVQKFIKRMRSWHKGSFRYFVAGEYGGKKGRAHWHFVMFTDTPIKDVKFKDNYFTHKTWPAGFSYWEKFETKNAYYAAKYVRTDGKDELEVGRHNSSLKPPLGDQFIRNLAQKYVDSGLAPQDLKYTFPDVKIKKTGKRRQFRLRDVSADNFLDYYIEAWCSKHPVNEMPPSELVMGRMDGKAAEEMESETYDALQVIEGEMERRKDLLHAETDQKKYINIEGRIYFTPDLLNTEPHKVKRYAEAIERLKGESSKAFHNTDNKKYRENDIAAHIYNEHPYEG